MSRFTPFPKLTTRRLILRELMDKDVDALFAMRSDANNRQFLSGPLEQSTDETQAFIEKVQAGILADQWILWALTFPREDALFGTICLWQFNEDHTIAEVGYELNPDAQGHGYMREALGQIVKYGFDILALKEIRALTNAANIRSRILLERCGFEFVKMVVPEDSRAEGMRRSALYAVVRTSQ